MTRLRFWPLLALAGATFAAGCRDATAPRLRPMSGVYSFTTRLDSISYEDMGPLGCGPNVMWYCTLWRADSTGSLAGTFDVADDGLVYNTGLEKSVYGNVSGLAAGRFGGQAVSVSISSGYLDGPLTMSDTSTHSVAVQLTGTAREGIRLSGTLAGDSIVGTVYWSQIVARSPPTYKGTFVAHRFR